VEEEWRPKDCLIGLHAQPDARYTEITVESAVLTSWSIEKWYARSREDDAQAESFTVPFPGMRKLARAANLEVGLHHSLTHVMGATDLSFRRTGLITVAHDSPMPLQRCLDEVAHLGSLLNLVFARAVPLAKITLREQSDVDGQHLHDYHGRMNDPARVADADPPRAPFVDALFSYEQFGGAAALAQWMDMPADLRYLTARIASGYDHEGRFLEDIALSSFAALESLSKVAAARESPDARSSRQRLVALAAKVPFFERSVIRFDIDQWARQVVDERNALAHAEIRPNQESDEYHHMWFLSETANMLSVLSVFRLAGISPAAIEAIPASQVWLWTIKGLLAR